VKAVFPGGRALCMNFSQIFSTNSLSQRVACAKMYGIVNGASWNRLQTGDWLRDAVQRCRMTI
jgi:hypothetical protein